MTTTFTATVLSVEHANHLECTELSMGSIHVAMYMFLLAIPYAPVIGQKYSWSHLHATPTYSLNVVCL